MTAAVRAHIISGVVVALALVGAFTAGRFSAPLQVETRNVERVVFKDRVVEKVVTVQTAAKVETKVVYRDRVVTKDGEVRERIVERTDTKEDTKATGTEERVATSEGTAERETKTTTTLRPDWRVGVLVGASLSTPFVPIAGPLVLGLEVDRRIVGGLSAGLWVNTVGAAGLSVAFEF